jgi:hypothetical protein
MRELDDLDAAQRLGGGVDFRINGTSSCANPSGKPASGVKP